MRLFSLCQTVGACTLLSLPSVAAAAQASGDPAAAAPAAPGSSGAQDRPAAAAAGSASPSSTPAELPRAIAVLERGGLTLWYPGEVQDGELAVVEIEPSADCKRPEVQWLGHALPVAPMAAVAGHWQSLVPVPLDDAEATPALLVRCGTVSIEAPLHVRPGMYPESKLSVDPKFDRKPPARTKAEQVAMTRAFAASAKGRRWSRGFVRPAVGVETSVFGNRRTFNGKTSSRHRGVDFDGRTGDAVLAANDGVVVLAAEDFYYTGNTIFIDHGDQLFTVYFHLDSLRVKMGEHVSAGQVIGAIGKTGRVTGPHLHFGVKLAGVYVNPWSLLGLSPNLSLAELARKAAATGNAAPASTAAAAAAAAAAVPATPSGATSP